MTASGPFALGPALAGSSRRSTPRSNFAPTAPIGSGSSSTLGAGLSHTAPPSLEAKVKREPTVSVNDDDYSDPDDGVEIIDIHDVKQMDWMAPETLEKENKAIKKKKDKVRVKKESVDLKDLGSGKGVSFWKMLWLLIIHLGTDSTMDIGSGPPSYPNNNAIDLSESEDEDESENLMDEFFTHDNNGMDEVTYQPICIT